MLKSDVIFNCQVLILTCNAKVFILLVVEMQSLANLNHLLPVLYCTNIHWFYLVRNSVTKAVQRRAHTSVGPNSQPLCLPNSMCT